MVYSFELCRTFRKTLPHIPGKVCRLSASNLATTYGPAPFIYQPNTLKFYTSTLKRKTHARVDSAKVDLPRVRRLQNALNAARVRGEVDVHRVEVVVRAEEEAKR